MGTEVSTSPKSLIDQTVVPGDVVLDLSNMTNQTIKLGSGLRQERKIVESTLEARKRLFSDCRILHDRLKVNNTNLSMDEQSHLREDLSEVSNALQDQIEVQLLLGFDETASEDELRKMMADIYAENINMKSM